MSHRIKKVGPFTQTVAANNSRRSDAFIGPTDKRPGDGQHLARVEMRSAQGQKMTPPGDVKLKKGVIR